LGHKMVALISFLVGIVIGFMLYRLIDKSNAQHDVQPDNLIERQSRAKQENLARIIKLFEEKKQITNDDVEDLLGVSHATATNYLDELELEEKIRQVGRTGRSVYYELRNN